MRVEFAAEPSAEGIYGPEIVLHAVSGVAALRREAGVGLREVVEVGPDAASRMPEGPLTNAFVVWVGRPVVVVSQGVSAENVPQVATALRGFLEDAAIPVVLSVSRADARIPARVCSDNPARHDPRELARAEAYVRIQAAWEESDVVHVTLDGASFALTVDVREGPDGEFAIRVR